MFTAAGSNAKFPQTINLATNIPKKSKIPNNQKIYFKHTNKPSEKQIVVRINDREYYKVSQQVLQTYFIYRNSVYTSYSIYMRNETLHADVLDLKKQKQYDSTTQEENDSLFHYSVKVAVRTALEWKLGQVENNALNCILAYDRLKQIGFIHFYQFTDPMSSKEVIYIAQLAISPGYQRQGIGLTLTKKVLTNYPPCTNFYVVTRKFNTAAHKLYFDKLGFSESQERDNDLIMYLGYNPNLYAGYRYTTPSNNNI